MASGATVATPSGIVEGIDLGSVAAYLGIPYAAPPTGPSRWRAPEPVPRWRGARSATALPPAPPQPTSVTPGGADLPGLTAVATDEDCLMVNVWSPRDGRDAPVMVWLPGGAFVTGGAGIPLYDGAALAARHGVVVVTVTYRVGAIGFAAVPDAVPNRGLLDQVAALTWVRDGIDAFGGDPHNVTVFGESAGGGSVLHLLAVPDARTLFHRAIVQSGATDHTLDRQAASLVATRVLDALDGDVDAPIGRVLAAQGDAMAASMADVGPMPFHPFVDGVVVTERPIAAVRAAAVPLLIGTTRDEMRMFFDPRPLDRDRLVRRVARYLQSLAGDGGDGADADGRAAALVDLYRDFPTEADAWSAVQTDGEMRRPAHAMADGHAEAGGPTFVYRFDEPLTGALAHLGACHGSDLPFPFGTIERGGWADVVGPAAAAVTTAMQTAWTAFARGDEPWPRYDTTRRATMVIDHDRRVVDDPDGARRARWAELARLRGS